jgi:hypothetical protein
MRGHEHGPSFLGGLLNERRVLLLEKGIKARGRLIKDEEFWIVHERLNQPDLPTIPSRKSPYAASHVQIESVRQLIDACAWDTTAEIAKVGQQFLTRLSAIDHKVVGQVPEAAPQYHPVRSGIETQHRHRATSRTDEIQKNPHRGRLASTVRAKETEHLASPDL